MKKLLIALIVSIIFITQISFASTDQEQNYRNDGLTLSLRLGASYLPSKPLTDYLNDTIEKNSSYGAVFGVGVGYKYRSLRNELNVLAIGGPFSSATYHGHDLKIDEGSTGLAAVMYNAYFDFDQFNNRFVPFVGAGIGVGGTFDTLKLQNGNKIDTESKTTSVFQTALGVNYFFTEHAFMTLEYNYLFTPNYTSSPTDESNFRGTLKSRFNAHMVSWKFNYLFF